MTAAPCAPAHASQCVMFARGVIRSSVVRSEMRGRVRTHSAAPVEFPKILTGSVLTCRAWFISTFSSGMLQPTEKSAGLASGPHPLIQRINEDQAILAFPGEIVDIPSTAVDMYVGANAVACD